MKRYSKTQLFDNKYYLSSYLINPNRIKQLYINYSQIQKQIKAYSRLIINRTFLSAKLRKKVLTIIGYKKKKIYFCTIRTRKGKIS